MKSTLLREYIWMDGVPVAVVEGRVVYYVRTDHIGRPVFATDSAGTKVWEATYLPFGEVLATSGNPIQLRFPGQWFQSESGLHQNWMRDYDPTTGRYMQADPLGLVDGASVYGYARQNPGRYVDPTGLCPICIPIIGGLIGGGTATGTGTTIGMGTVIAGGIALSMVPNPTADGENAQDDAIAESGEASCGIPPRNECIAQCRVLALPTLDYGISFFRCMNSCLSNGNSGFPEWDKHFP